VEVLEVVMTRDSCIVLNAADRSSSIQAILSHPLAPAAFGIQLRRAGYGWCCRLELACVGVVAAFCRK